LNTSVFIPTTPEEVHQMGWKSLDVIIVSGDTYLDSSYIGAAVIGRVLLEAGYRVGILAQPDVQTDKDIARLGEPELFGGLHPVALIRWWLITLLWEKGAKVMI
jgi:hypothetical protein